MFDPARLYRALLRLYPAHFREEYQAPRSRVGEEYCGPKRGLAVE